MRNPNRHLLLVLSAALLLLAACSSGPEATPLYSPGMTVRLGDEGDTFGVGLWLMYEDSCDVDVVYNYVPAGTTATIAGPVCIDGGTIYYKVSFSKQVVSDNGISSANTWVAQQDVVSVIGQ